MIEQFLRQESKTSIINISDHMLKNSIVHPKYNHALTKLNNIDLSRSSSSGCRLDHNMGKQVN